MEIAPGIYSIGQWMGGHVHAYLLDDGSGLTVIDTLYDTDGGRILREISRIGRTVADLQHIVLTHAHRSHLGGMAALKRLSGATVCAHAWEADIIAGEREAQRVSPIPKRPLRVYPIQFGLAVGFGKHRPCQLDRVVADGDRIGPLQVIHAPGHTPGHLAFYWPERRALFAGDAVATWPEFAAGWPGLHLNMTQLWVSLRRLAQFDAGVLAVGHGEPIARGGAERLRALVQRDGQ